MIYTLIGKLVVKAMRLYLSTRYGRQIRFALGFSLAAAVIGGYLAAREVPEG